MAEKTCVCVCVRMLLETSMVVPRTSVWVLRVCVCCADLLVNDASAAVFCVFALAFIMFSQSAIFVSPGCVCVWATVCCRFSGWLAGGLALAKSSPMNTRAALAHTRRDTTHYSNACAQCRIVSATRIHVTYTRRTI